MKKSMMAERPLDRWAKAAVRGCDWFVNSQLQQAPPNWNANHGRYMYNVHVPSGFTTMGLGWTQARAVMCLLAAYKRTGDAKYLESAGRGIQYAKMLQNMDRRFPVTYGAFHEETPHSPFSYPRDAIEVAEGLLQWHVATGDADALYRAELFLAWFKRNAVTVHPGFGYWVRGSVRFDDEILPERFKGPVACEMGCGTILAHAYRVTGKPGYKSMALRIADSTLKNYAAEGGALRVPASRRMGHHTAGDGVMYNDDGGSVSLLNAYKLTGKQRYLDAAVAAADFFNTLKTPIPLFSGVGSVANFLLETDRVTGAGRYRKTAERLGRRLLAMQVNSGGKGVRGGFRGEDEGGKWYVTGSESGDFVTTRVTAYAVLTLFKLEGVVWPRGYSVEW